MKEKETYTKYEIARIIAARALQLSMNAPILIKISKEELEKINYDVIKIAEMEFKEGVLPITIKRPQPIKKKIAMFERKLAEEEIEKEVSHEEIREQEKEIVGGTISEMLEDVEDEENEETKNIEEEGFEE